MVCKPDHVVWRGATSTSEGLLCSTTQASQAEVAREEASSDLVVATVVADHLHHELQGARQQVRSASCGALPTSSGLLLTCLGDEQHGVFASLGGVSTSAAVDKPPWQTCRYRDVTLHYTSTVLALCVLCLHLCAHGVCMPAVGSFAVLVRSQNRRRRCGVRGLHA